MWCGVLHLAVLLREYVVRVVPVAAVDRVVQKVRGDLVDLGDVLHHAVLLEGSERVGLEGVLHLAVLLKVCVAQVGLVVVVDRVVRKGCGDRVGLEDVLCQAVLLKGSGRVGRGNVLRLVAPLKGCVAHAEPVVAEDRVGQRAYGAHVEFGASVGRGVLESLAVRVGAMLDGLVGELVRCVYVRCGLWCVWF